MRGAALVIALALAALLFVALGFGAVSWLLLRAARRRRDVGPRWALRLARVLAVELLAAAAGLVALAAYAAVILATAGS